MSLRQAEITKHPRVMEDPMNWKSWQDQILWTVKASLRLLMPVALEKYFFFFFILEYS